MMDEAGAGAAAVDTDEADEPWPDSLVIPATPTCSDEDEDEFDDPSPLIRVHTVTVKGIVRHVGEILCVLVVLINPADAGLMHNFVPVTDEDSGKRCVVDGFPATKTMRFMGLYTQQTSDDTQRCVVQIENPEGEDTVLMEKGLLVRLVRVKLAPDEAIVGAHVLKQGGSVKSWRRRYATLDGDGYLRYYVDASKKRLKGLIDIRRDCLEVSARDSETAWPSGVKEGCRLCIITEQRTYYICFKKPEVADAWALSIARVARNMQKKRVSGRGSGRPESLVSQSDFSAISKSAVMTDNFRKTPTDESDGRGEEEATSVSPSFTEDPSHPLPRRLRRHFFRPALTNSTQVCRATGKKIGMRAKHMLCTQCRKRYLTAHAPTDLADCEPPAFGTPAASKRIAPPPWVNLASTVAHTSTSGRIPGIIEDLIATINSRGIVEGIYRVPGDRRATSQLIERYFNDPRRKRLGIYTIASIHTCGSALKQFFRELDEPLLTFDGYNNFVQATKLGDPQSRCDAITAELGRLPLFNFCTLRALIEHLQHIAANVEVTKMKFSNLAAVFAPTMMACPGGDEAGLRDVMAHMVCMDTLLKLGPEAWEAAQIQVDTAVRLQSASPIPERRGSSESAKSPRHSNTEITPPDNGPDTSRDTPEIPAESEPGPTADAEIEPAEIPSDEEVPAPRSSHRIRSSSITSSDQKDEVSQILDEAGGDGTDEIFGFEGLDVEEGQGEGALFPGLEAYAIDAGEQATLTLVSSRRTKTRTTERITAQNLGVASSLDHVPEE